MPKLTIRATHVLRDIFRRATKGRLDLPNPNPEEVEPKGPLPGETVGPQAR